MFRERTDVYCWPTRRFELTLKRSLGENAPKVEPGSLGEWLLSWNPMKILRQRTLSLLLFGSREWAWSDGERAKGWGVVKRSEVLGYFL